MADGVPKFCVKNKSNIFYYIIFTQRNVEVKKEYFFQKNVIDIFWNLEKNCLRNYSAASLRFRSIVFTSLEYLVGIFYADRKVEALRNAKFPAREWENHCIITNIVRANCLYWYLKNVMHFFSSVPLIKKTKRIRDDSFWLMCILAVFFFSFFIKRNNLNGMSYWSSPNFR